MKEGLGNNTPSPDDLKALQASITMLTERGAVRGEARELLKVLEKDNTWGLPKDQVKASIRALGNFMKRPAIFQEDIEDLTKVFKQEEKFARIDWTEKKKAIGERIKKAKDVTLRVAVAALGIGGLYLIGSEVTAWNAANSTPEVVAQREAENQQRQEAIRVKQEQERQEKIKVENTRTLGLTPSAISEKGFRIRYNPFDKSVRYVEVGGELGYFNISNTYSTRNYVNWDQRKNDKEKISVETNIYVGYYNRVEDGKRLPALVSGLTGTVGEAWYLRDISTEEIDASVVVFEDVRNQKEYYLKISSPDNYSNFQFKLMTKVPVTNQ